MLVKGVEIDVIFRQLEKVNTRFVKTLSFKYELNRITDMPVDEVNILANLFVRLTWTEEKTLKDAKNDNLIKERIAKEIMEGFSNFGFWIIRYRDIVQEGYPKAKFPKLDDDDGFNY